MGFNIKTPFVTATHIKKFTSSSSLVNKTKAAALGSISGQLYFHNGTSAQPLFLDRAELIDAVAIDGAALHAAVLPIWTAPADAIVTRVLLDVTTVATGACTVDVGYTAVSSTTSSDTFLDGIDTNSAVVLADSMDAALDSGANAKAQKAASGKWITADEKTGDSTGMVAVAYIFYVLV